MKILIWAGCLVVSIVVSTIIDLLLYSSGISLGYMLRYLIIAGIAIPSATALCKKWDEHRGVRFDENIPIPCIREAEQYRGRTTELSAYLKGCVKSGLLTKAQANYLYKSFSKNTYND